MEHDAVARPDRADPLTNVHDLAAALVPKKVRQKPVGPFHTVHLPHLRPADTACEHADEHLPQFRSGHLDDLDHEGATLLDQNRGTGFHGRLTGIRPTFRTLGGLGGTRPS